MTEDHERIDELLRLASLELDVVVLLERETRERREEHDDAGVHDVAAVPTTIPPDEPEQRNRDRLAVNPPPCADALHELLRDGRGDEPGERVGHERVAVSHA